MAFTLGKKCAKNLCKWTVLLQLIIENVVTCFFGTQCMFFHAKRHSNIPTGTHKRTLIDTQGHFSYFYLKISATSVTSSD